MNCGIRVAARIRVGLAALLTATVGTSTAWVADLWEPDGDVAADAVQFLVSGHPPQLHDLEASGGVADTDLYRVIVRPNRSYEARIESRQKQSAAAAFERRDQSGTTVLQSASNFSAVGFVQVDPYFLRWETGGSISGNDAVNVLRVAGQATGTASSVYSIAFRETTLFCPRFNNTGTQVSVLIVQSAHYGANSCSFNAHFYNEAGALVGTQPGTLDVDGKVIVISMPTVSGAANERGAARITHTCGYGNVKSKLVALEPANGFSFDTPCTTRE